MLSNLKDTSLHRGDFTKLLSTDTACWTLSAYYPTAAHKRCGQAELVARPNATCCAADSAAAAPSSQAKAGSQPLKSLLNPNATAFKLRASAPTFTPAVKPVTASGPSTSASAPSTSAPAPEGGHGEGPEPTPFQAPRQQRTVSTSLQVPLQHCRTPFKCQHNLRGHYVSGHPKS